MQRQSGEINGFRRKWARYFVAVCRMLRGVLVHSSWALLVPALVAGPTPWGVGAPQTGIKLTGPVPLLSPGGDLYFCNSNSMLVKMDATGRQIFAVPAACNDAAIVWSPDGNILTGGAKLSGVDGRLLFLTGDYPSVAGDTVGNVYLAGICGSTLCVQKLDSLGKLIYRTSLQAPFSANAAGSIAPDADG